MQEIINGNLNFYFNQVRAKASFENLIGPKILVLGSIYSGKTSLCKSLSNMAIKCGWNPLFVDLDIKKNSMAAGT